MAENYPQLVDRDAPIFTIGVAARLAGMHPQTLRTYDRQGLVSPQRTRGRGRRYSPRDVARLRMVQHLSQEEGINLVGIQRILEMEAQLEQMREQLAHMGRLLDQAQRSPLASRVFTAESSGAVHLGRQARQQLALPPR